MANVPNAIEMLPKI